MEDSRFYLQRHANISYALFSFKISIDEETIGIISISIRIKSIYEFPEHLK